MSKDEELPMNDPKANSRPAFHRRRFWVYPAFQARFISWLMVPILLNVIAYYFVTHFLISAIRLQIQSKMIIDGHLFDELSAAQDRTVLYTFWSAAFFSTFLTWAWGLTASHRIAGPLFKLRRQLQKLASHHDTSMLHFRKSDLLKEVAVDYNAAMTAISDPQQKSP